MRKSQSSKNLDTSILDKSKEIILNKQTVNKMFGESQKQFVDKLSSISKQVSEKIIEKKQFAVIYIIFIIFFILYYINRSQIGK